MERTTTNRIDYIDLAKGFCIILVVLYHVLNHLHVKSEYVYLLSTFRMPLYFFLSGLFFKEYEGFMGFFIRKINKLLIPFCFFYLTTSFFLPNILHFWGFTVSHTESLGIHGLWAFITKEQFANNPIWFLWCLFTINIFFYLCVVIVKKIFFSNVWQAVVLTIVCFTIGMANSLFIASHINLWVLQTLQWLHFLFLVWDIFSINLQISYVLTHGISIYPFSLLYVWRWQSF